MDDHYWDAFLNIQTAEQKGFTQNIHYHRYEPTPYAGLNELFNVYEFNRSDRIVDFGCGKGRFPFYVHHVFQPFVTGVEMDEHLYKMALHNQSQYFKKKKKDMHKINFFHGTAEEYIVQREENKFYFFNPFTVQVFMKVVHNIIQSVEENARNVDLLLYYPSNDYIYFLENQTAFTFVQEVKIPRMYERNANERFLVYRL